MLEASAQHEIISKMRFLKIGKRIFRRLIPGRRQVRHEIPDQKFLDDLNLLASTTLFDPEWYLQTYPDLRGLDPYVHFLKYGGIERRESSDRFNTSAYLAMYPDVDSRFINPLIHYLRQGQHEGRSPGLSAAKIFAIDKTISDVEDLDPQIKNSQALHVERERLPANSSIPHGAVPLAWSEIFEQLHRDMRYLFFMPRMSRSDADSAALNLVKAAIIEHGPRSVLLIIVDCNQVEMIERLPIGAQILVLSDFDPGLSAAGRQRIVEMLIFSLLPFSMLNMDSEACWKAICAKGIAFHSMTKIYGSLPSRDYSADGCRLPTTLDHIRHCMPYLTKLYVDTVRLIDVLEGQYCVSAEYRSKFQLLRLPAALSESTVHHERPHAEAPKILWTEDLGQQSNTDLLIRIIALLPEFQFQIYCSGETHQIATLRKLVAKKNNVVLHGAFQSVSELPLDTISAILHTPRSDGTPARLISLASSGLPIIAGAVGSVPEIVDADSGWLIIDSENEFAYAKAIKEAITCPANVRKKSAHMMDKLRAERSWSVFLESASAFPSFLNKGSANEPL